MQSLHLLKGQNIRTGFSIYFITASNLIQSPKTGPHLTLVSPSTLPATGRKTIFKADAFAVDWRYTGEVKCLQPSLKLKYFHQLYEELRSGLVHDYTIKNDKFELRGKIERHTSKDWEHLKPIPGSSTKICSLSGEV